MKKITILLVSILLVVLLLPACTESIAEYETFQGIVSGIKSSDKYTVIYINGNAIRVEDSNISLAIGREYKITTKDPNPKGMLYSRVIYKIEIID